jgi:uncharacterized protein
VKSLRPFVLGVFVAAYCGSIVILFTDLLEPWLPLSRAALWMFVETRGLVPFTLAAGIARGAILIGGILVLWGGLRPRDLGLCRSRLANAGVVLALLWALTQLTTAALIRPDTTALAVPLLAQQQVTVIAGRLADVLVATALVEEVVYRGVLVPQIYLMSAAWWPDRPGRRAAVAVIVPQVLFALNHIPGALSAGTGFGPLALFIVHALLVGILFAAIYLRTGNLYLAVGVHALINEPAALFASAIDPSLVVLVLSVLMLLTWPTLARLFADVFTLQPGWPEWVHPLARRPLPLSSRTA